MAKSSEVVVRRPDRAIETQAAKTRDFFGLSPDDKVNMAKLLDNVLTKNFPGYTMEVEEDHRMNGCEAITDKRDARITFSWSTYDALCRGDWRARMTAAHELGHLFLHCGRWWGRVGGWVHPENDPEKQADIFAAAFLMPAAAFRKVRSIEEAQKKFGVSRDAATCRARKLGLAKKLHIYDAPQHQGLKRKGRKPVACTP